MYYIDSSLCVIACFYTFSLHYIEDGFILKHILLKTYFRLFLSCSVLSIIVSIRAWGGGGEEGGGGENAVGCLVCSFCPKDLLNLICLKYVFFFLICYLVVLLDSVIYCSL